MYNAILYKKKYKVCIVDMTFTCFILLFKHVITFNLKKLFVHLMHNLHFMISVLYVRFASG